MNRVFRRQSQVAELDLAVRAGERHGAGDGAAVVIFLREPTRLVLALGIGGAERDARGRTRRKANGMSQADDRIEHGADRIRQRSPRRHRDRPVERAAAAEEPGPVGFELRRCATGSAAAEHVHQVAAVVARARTPDGDQCVPFNDPFRVSMNRLLNAGCARSASAGASTTSA